MSCCNDKNKTKCGLPLVNGVRPTFANLIPLTFDNTLSYYEQLCAFAKKLDEVICSVNAQSLTICDIMNGINDILNDFEDKFVTKVEYNEFVETINITIGDITDRLGIAEGDIVNIKGDIVTINGEIVDIWAAINAWSDTGVGEWIEEGTEYVYDGVTYTAHEKCEIFNSYDDGTGVDLHRRNQAAGYRSHAEGSNTKALGSESHTEGYATVAIQTAAHAEGQSTVASGADGSHAEGRTTTASGSASHAEGYNSIAEGDYTHAENSSYASGDYAHSEGYSIKDTVTPANSTGALADYSHTEGYNCTASGVQGSHAEGYGSKAVGACTHAEGYQTQAIGNYSHTEGYNNLCVAERGHVEGQGNQIVTGACKYSHAEGINNIISDAETAHAEGDNNKIIVGSNRAHVEGYDNIITGDIAVQNSGSWEAHAEGRSNRIEHSYRAHVEGHNNNIYKSNSAHAEGYGNTINRNCESSHAEGTNNVIGDSLGNSAATAHVQGDSNTATSNQASATGYHTSASGVNSTTMGYYTHASGAQAVAIGTHTYAIGANQLAMGDYNIPNNSITSLRTDGNGNTYTLTKFPIIIGNGYHGNVTETDITSDAFKVDCDGKIYVGTDTVGVDVKALSDTIGDINTILASVL